MTYVPNTEPTVFRTIPEIVELARARLPRPVWDGSFGGAGGETTLRRNRAAFESLAFRPRLLRGVADRDLSTTFLGYPLSLPVMLAPVGSIGNYDPGGGVTWARGATRAGTIAFISMGSAPQPEALKSVEHGPVVLQLYVDGDQEWLRQFVAHAEGTGYAAICLTADAPTRPRLDRDLLNGRPLRDAKPNADGIRVEGRTERYRSSFDWDDLSRLRDLTKLPLILKGVLAAEDAGLAVERGVDAIYVSNHGGRSVDHFPSSIEVLPGVVQAVGGRAEVIADSGYMRGGDVVKALALGARAVLIGRLGAWALAAGGEAGLLSALDLLRTEIDLTMAGIGARTLAEIDSAFLMPTFAPAEAPWPTHDGRVPAA